MNTGTKSIGENEMTAAKLVKRGSILSGGASLIAVIFTLIAMGNVWVFPMVSLSIIALGIAFLSEGGTIAARFSELLPETSRRRSEVSKLGAGLSFEVGGGLIAAILGILALLNIAASVLVPVAVLVFGITMIFGSGVVFWFDSLMTGRSGELTSSPGTAHEAIVASGWLQFVLGLAAFVLAIMSLASVSPLLMNRVGLLCVGFSELLTGAAMSVRMWNYTLSHAHVS
jgi:hypothetical protein